MKKRVTGPTAAEIHDALMRLPMMERQFLASSSGGATVQDFVVLSDKTASDIVRGVERAEKDITDKRAAQRAAADSRYGRSDNERAWMLDRAEALREKSMSWEAIGRVLCAESGLSADEHGRRLAEWCRRRLTE